jgi:RHS repeat-associated protein
MIRRYRHSWLLSAGVLYVLVTVFGYCVVSYGRVIEVKVNGTGSLGHERFAYDQEGRLLLHTREQGALLVTETFAYDALGRQVGSTVDNAAVDGVLTQLVSSSLYDLAAHRITSSDPRAAGSNAPVVVTVTSLDALGRPFSIERGVAGAPLLRSAMAYDRMGNLAHESDTVHTAVVHQHDAVGREVARIAADGTRTTFVWSPWSELLDEIAYDSASQVVAHTTRTYSEKGTPDRVSQQIDHGATPAGRNLRTLWSDGETEVTSTTGTGTFGQSPQPANRRAVKQSFDTSGRTQLTEVLGPGMDVLHQAMVTSFRGDAPAKVSEGEPFRGASSGTSSIGFDDLGRPISNEFASGTWTSTRAYDEAGNVVTSKAPGLPPQSAAYDGRGLTTLQTLSDGSTLNHKYDALGNPTAYIDQAGKATTYTRDVLGRVTTVTYADGTTENMVYEAVSGRLLRKQDRAAVWLSYAYDAVGRVTEVHTGVDPADPSTKYLLYDYDAAGRLTRVRNADAGSEYASYDLLGRPGITRTVLYQNHSGMATTPAELDVFTQSHTWSVFGERTSWTMPAPGRTPVTADPASPWRNVINETRDEGGNLVDQSVLLTPPGGGIPAPFPLLTATPAGVGKLLTRTRAMLTGLPIVTTYGYVDTKTDVPPQFATLTTLGSELPSGALHKVTTTRGSAGLAGGELYRDAGVRTAITVDQGLGSRASAWDYDNRGRLKTAKLLASTLPRKTSEPPPIVTNTGSVEQLEPWDFRKARSEAQFLDADTRNKLGAALAATIEPPQWTATEKPDVHQTDVKSIAATSTTASFTWAASRRTSDGRWTSTYDPMGRLATMVNGDRTIVYVYGPNDRIVQRTALHGGVPEDRPGILAADGLPAQTSWIWDPATDRLVAVFETGKSLTASTPTTGLLRQFLHGDQAYDDPTEALIASISGGTPRRLIVLRDEAATGNTQAVADGATGNLIERVLYGDSYGDAPRYLQGPVVDRITYGATKSSNGTLTSVDILIHLDEAVTPASIPSGVVVRSIKTDLTPASANVGTGTINPLDPYTIKWTLTSADWAALNAATGAHALEVAVTSTLHADAWGTTSVQPAPTWLQTTSGATTATGFPLIQRQDLTSVTAFIATITSGPKTADPLYELTNLHTAAVTTSVTNLDLDFQGLPFRDPATGMIYARNRWYDPGAGTGLTPDPLGFRDSSTVYAFATGNPINGRDPLGMGDSESMVAAQERLETPEEARASRCTEQRVLGSLKATGAIAAGFVTGTLSFVKGAFSGDDFIAENEALDDAQDFLLHPGKRYDAVLEEVQQKMDAGDCFGAGETLHGKFTGPVTVVTVGTGLAIRDGIRAGTPKETFPRRSSVRPSGRPSAEFIDDGGYGRTPPLESPVQFMERIRPSAPISIPKNAEAVLQNKARGYVQARYTWADAQGQTWSARLHTATPNAPLGTRPNWVVTRSIPGTRFGVLRQAFVLVGENWVTEELWDLAKKAYGNGTATNAQKQMLKQGHHE